MDRLLRPFKISGTFKDDAEMLNIREKFTIQLEDIMRAKGHVPVLNLVPKWVISWNQEQNSYDFTIVMYGVYTGAKKAQKIIGWDSDLDKWYS